MEQIYCVGPEVSQAVNWLKDERALNVALSCRNIVVFTSTHNLLNEGSKLPQYQKEYFVYVCDMDKPWNVYKISQYDEEITQVAWHVGGSQLLLVSASGSLQIWSMKDYMLDQWECINTTYLAMEEVVAVSWLHTWTQMNYNVDKKDMMLYTDKVVPARFMPTLTQFGGKATDGWLAVSCSGLVCVGLLSQTSSGVKVITQKVPLSSTTRYHISRADMAFSPNGEIIVATNDGLVTSSILCFTITLKMVSESCIVTPQARAGFFLRSLAEFKDSPNARVTHVKFPFQEDPNNLIVDVTNGNSSCTELWNFLEQKIGLHRVFHSSDARSGYVEKWMHKGSLNSSGTLTSVAQSRLPVIQAMPESSLLLLQCLALTYRDGTVKIVHRHTFQVLLSYNLKAKSTSVGHGEKKLKTSPFVVSCQLTLTGCSLLCLDSDGALNLISIVSAKDVTTAVSYLVPLLEYCLYTGYDWWDVLLSLKPNVVDSVVQRLQDNYNKQPSFLKSMTQTKFLAIKASLYNILGSNQPKASDTRCKLLLVCVYQTFNSMLAPRDISSQDKSGGDKLSQLCGHNTETDISKLVLGVDRAEFHVDNSTLHSMQHLIQWVGDFTLYIIATLPVLQTYSNIPGASIIRDVKCLSMLRELLVIIRMNSTTMPSFTCSVPNQDNVSLLFKLLTKLWLSIRDGNNMELDDMLIDECCVIPGKIFVPSVDQCLILDSSGQPSIANQHQAVQCKFGDAPKLLARPSPIHHLPDGTSVSYQKRDVLRQINVGKIPSQDIRRCSRCNTVSLLKSPVSTPLSQAWDQRWTKLCICGGQWVTMLNEVES